MERSKETDTGNQLALISINQDVDGSLSDGSGTKNESNLGIPPSRSANNSDDDRLEDDEPKKKGNKKKNIVMDRRITRSTKEVEGTKHL